MKRIYKLKSIHGVLQNHCSTVSSTTEYGNQSTVIKYYRTFMG